MRILKRIFTILSVTLLSIVVFAVLVVGVAWFFPSLWLNETTVRMASRFLPEVGVNVHWQGPANIEVETTSLFGKRVRVQTEKLCVGIADAGTDTCVDSLDLDATVLLRFGFKIQRIDKLVIKGARVTVVPMASAPEAPKEEEDSDSSFQLPVGLDTAVLGQIHLGLHSLAVRTSDGTIGGRAELSLSQPDKAGAEKGLAWMAYGEASYRAKNAPPERLKFDLAAVQARHSVDSIRKLDLTAEYRGSFLLPLHLKLGFEDRKVHLDITNAKAAPSILVGDMYMTKSEKGLFSELTDAKAKFMIEDFARVVAAIRKTPFAVPSPLNVLGGPVEILAEYHTGKKSEPANIPMTVTTTLKSRTQLFNTKTEGKLELGQKTKLTLNANIKSILLMMPTLDLQKIPPIFPDGRIHTTDGTVLDTDENSSFEYFVTIQTEQPNSILIVSNVAKQPIPIGLNLRLMSGQPIAGKIHAGRAQLDVLRRNASLQKVDLEFPGTSTPPRLNAELSVKYSEYTVFVHVFGNTEKPDFFLTSDPPLSDADAMSVLLFGQTASELDSGESDSLAGTQAAVANRAVNLASMYLLATTPIESVGYDPVSNTVSARVRLRDGTTLQMKSSGRGVAGVGLRQRLGGPWSVRTEIENMNNNSSTDEERSASAVLEWSKRY